MIFYIIILLVLAILAIAIFHGVFKKVYFSEKSFPESYLIYQNHQMRYMALEKPAMKIKHTAQSFPIIKDLTQTGKMKLFGLYYDNPNMLIDQNKARSTVGLLVQKQVIDELDSSKRNDFFEAMKILKERHQIQNTTLPSSQTLWTQFPFRSSLSYAIGPTKVYPGYMREFKKNEIKIDFSVQAGCLEAYQKNNIQFFFPTGVNRKHFMLSDMERPDYKPGTKLFKDMVAKNQ